jgi:RNA polymerase-binding transcription factor DksA
MAMNKKDLEKYKKLLLTEKETLESEMEEIGVRDPNNSNNWDASTKNMEVDMADENEVADKLEEMEDNNSVISELEVQLKNVNDALYKIDNGTYGNCEVCGKPIEKERLEANPSSRVSIKHAH